MSTTQQPDWELIANLGDVNHIDYGGYFIYRDKTGHYTEEAERCEPTDDSAKTHEIHRFILERCTDEAGILSDNPYHKDHPAWFAKDLPSIAESCDHATIRADLCSADPLIRARAYESIGLHWSFENFDSYPLTLPRHETQVRYGYTPDRTMKETTTALMQGLTIRRIECSRRLWCSRNAIAEHYRAQRANGLLTSINAAAGMSSNPEHARQLRNLLKGEPTE